MDPATRLHLGDLLGTDVTAARDLGGQHSVRHYRIWLADGRSAFAKVGNRLPGPGAAGRAAAAPRNEQGIAEGCGVSSPSRAITAGSGGLVPPEDTAGFAAEAAGLRWLAEAAAIGVPLVFAQSRDCLVTDWVETGPSSRDAAARFGRELADLHAAGADRFGAPWPGEIAGLPLPNDADDVDGWPDWYVTHRVLPYARIGRDAGTLGPADTALIESACARAADVAGPPEPPARLHGDCWSGNVLWSGGRGWLIDPAAHGGHRETDLAMLSLFDAPYLDTMLAVYQEVMPLADGWRGRVPLHQLHPLLVHVCLFGAAYRDGALAAARSVLAR
jgi:fructosamine-3-kinase